MPKITFKRSFSMIGWSLLALALHTTQISHAKSKYIEHQEQGQAYPLVYHHVYGDTVIKKEPKRVITFGWGSGGLMLSLGTVPVGLAKEFWGGDDQGYLPWVKEYVSKNNLDLPKAIQVSPEADIETIIKLRPDLIVVLQAEVNKAQYQQLSQIAPVIANPTDQWLVPIPEHINILSTLLNKEEKGEEMKDYLENKYKEIRQSHPQFSQLSFAYLYVTNKQLSLYAKNDPRVNFMSKIGFQMSPVVKKLLTDRPEAFVGIGLENADMLNTTDILLTWFNSKMEKDEVTRIPLFKSINAVQNGTFYPFIDRQLSSSLTYATPLSLDWGLPRFMPTLEQLVERAIENKQNKTTKVQAAHSN